MKKILMTLTLALGAMIAIPAAANAQSTTTATTQKECCKEKKECCKEEGKACCKEKKECGKEEGKACCKEKKECGKKEGKACCKEGNGPKMERKIKGGKMMKGERKLNAPKEARMGKGGGKENLMFKGITLTDDQKAKMKALREKNSAAEKTAKADMKAKSKDEMQKLRAEFDKEVEKILDKDQLKQYQANKAEMEAKRAAKK